MVAKEKPSSEAKETQTERSNHSQQVQFVHSQQLPQLEQLPNGHVSPIMGFTMQQQQQQQQPQHMLPAVHDLLWYHQSTDASFTHVENDQQLRAAFSAQQYQHQHQQHLQHLQQLHLQQQHQHQQQSQLQSQLQPHSQFSHLQQQQQQQMQLHLQLQLQQRQHLQQQQLQQHEQQPQQEQLQRQEPQRQQQQQPHQEPQPQQHQPPPQASQGFYAQPQQFSAYMGPISDTPSPNLFAAQMSSMIPYSATLSPSFLSMVHEPVMPYQPLIRSNSANASPLLPIARENVPERKRPRSAIDILAAAAAGAERLEKQKLGESEALSTDLLSSARPKSAEPVPSIPSPTERPTQKPRLNQGQNAGARASSRTALPEAIIDGVPLATSSDTKLDPHTGSTVVSSLLVDGVSAIPAAALAAAGLYSAAVPVTVPLKWEVSNDFRGDREAQVLQGPKSPPIRLTSPTTVPAFSVGSKLRKRKCQNRECSNVGGQKDKPGSIYCSKRCQSREQNIRQGRIKNPNTEATRRASMRSVQEFREAVMQANLGPPVEDTTEALRQYMMAATGYPPGVELAMEAPSPTQMLRGPAPAGSVNGADHRLLDLPPLGSTEFTQQSYGGFSGDSSMRADSVVPGSAPAIAQTAPKLEHGLAPLRSSSEQVTRSHGLLHVPIPARSEARAAQPTPPNNLSAQTLLDGQKPVGAFKPRAEIKTLPSSSKSENGMVQIKSDTG